MPQLFPMNWNILILFFFFSIMLSSSLIYFLSSQKLFKMTFKKPHLKKLWNW
uniref:ATP synthase F0 subunit 8 n=1 Tax=Ornithodoros hermsi TaxID=303297 RepID=A0A3G2K019_9ACAR|nr:ATP synthase F0 subunit 8 [Ornithodoros hermsi]AYN50640.1 ATP synthase F0 subunit 8 [Ornithodoros hermsi]UYB78369.1 ATP synthase F0 subunit 8 [Ornithodoros hermsi]